MLGKNKNILINGNTYNSKNFNIISINEENDFTNEFKFTKNNTLKQIIYNDAINKINEEKIVKYTNEIFDVIDEKVNNVTILLSNFLKTCYNHYIYYEWG